MALAMGNIGTGAEGDIGEGVFQSWRDSACTARRPYGQRTPMRQQNCQSSRRFQGCFVDAAPVICMKAAQSRCGNAIGD
jgi:hypothetical protein